MRDWYLRALRTTLEYFGFLPEEGSESPSYEEQREKLPFGFWVQIWIDAPAILMIIEAHPFWWLP